MKKAYICSPLRADTQDGIKQNMLAARRYMESIARYDFSTIATHAYLPEILDDNIPEERALALMFGQEVLALCDALIICGHKISQGMSAEIQLALKLEKEIYMYHTNVDHSAEYLRILNIEDVLRLLNEHERGASYEAEKCNKCERTLEVERM